MNESQRATCVGIDIGGTHTRIAIVDELGRVLADRKCDTPTEEDGEALARWLDENYHVCREEADSFPTPEVIGVGVPGILEPGRSAVIRAVNLPFLEGLPLRDRLVERTGLMTVIDCDTVAAAWGEYRVRKIDGDATIRRFGYLTLGTGVGAAILINGEVVRHTHHTGGHIGHLIIDASNDAPECGCGARGCVEAFVSAPAIRRHGKAAGLDLSLGEMEHAVQEGDAAVKPFVDGLARRLATACANINRIYEIGTLVVGGGVSAGLPSVVYRAAEVVRRDVPAFGGNEMRIELSALGDYSGVVGAALLALEHGRRMAD